MKWVKMKVDLFFRLRQIIAGLDWLITVYIPLRYNGRWFITKTTIQERVDCFIACIDTAIRGYVYGVEEEK